MSEYIIAIELGSSKIVGVAGYRNENGELVVSAIEKEPVAANIIKRGCVQNVKDVFACIKRVKMKLENRIAPARIEKLYVGVGGMSVVADDKISNCSFSEDSIIKQEHVEKMKNDCRSTISQSVDLLELVSTGYIIDGRPERNPIGATGTIIEARYKAVTAKPTLKRNIVRCIADLKLPIAGYITSALATAEVVLNKEERMLGCMLIDMGAETTTVSIYKNDTLVLLETLPMGGRNITRDIMSLNLVYNEAEKLKIASGKAKGFKSENNIHLRLEGDNTMEIDLAKLSSVVEARSEEIVANIEEQIKRSGLDRKELVSGAVVVGGAANLDGLLSLLEDHLGMKVRKGVLRRDIQVVEKEQIQVNDYLQAVGLLSLAKGVCTSTPIVEDVEETPLPSKKEIDVSKTVGDKDSDSTSDLKKDEEKSNKKGFWNFLKNLIEEGENED